MIFVINNNYILINQKLMELKEENMKRLSKKMFALLLSLAMILSMSTVFAFAEGEAAQPYSASITIIDGNGAEHPVTGAEIQAAQKFEGTMSFSKDGKKTEFTGTFYSMKSIFETAGVDYSSGHGVKAVASDNFATGYKAEDFDNVYIFDMSQVITDGKPAGDAGKYRTAVDGSAGNKWASDVVKFEITNSHEWFKKKGECKHYCSICNESEPSVMVGETQVYECQMKDNAMSVKVANKTVKFSKLKKKAQTVKAITVKGNTGDVTYKLKSASKSKKYFSVTKAGKIKIKKGLKKGKYTLKISVTDAGGGTAEEYYKGATKTVKVKIVVK